MTCMMANALIIQTFIVRRTAIFASQPPACHPTTCRHASQVATRQQYISPSAPHILVIHVVSFAARPGHPGDSVQVTVSDNAIMKDEAAEEFVMGSDKDGSDAIQVEEDAVELFASEEEIEVQDDIVEEKEAEEEVFEENPGSWWRCKDREAGMRKMAADADAISVWASGFPMSEDMPDGFRTDPAATLPWKDHWWVGPMEEAGAMVKARPPGRATAILEAAVFSLVDGRALVYVSTFER